MSSALTPYHSRVQPGRDGFPQLLRAEWIKFRTVRGWVTGTLAAALLIILFAVLTGASSVQHDHGGRPVVPIGPGGGPVTDSFYFVHQPLTGNGSVTISVGSLKDTAPAGAPGQQPGLVPWAKAGLIIRENTSQGSPYAAIMATGSHGVRMQDNYIHDRGGLPGRVSAASVRWLRLTRSGETVVGYDSADGTHWSEVGSVHLPGLRPTAAAGLFVASPPAVHGGGTVPTAATAVFGAPQTQGQWAHGSWIGSQVGAGSPSFSGYPPSVTGSFARSGGEITVTGAGDIAPAVREALAGGVIGDLLVGTFPALIAVIVVAVMFIAAEYQQGLIHTTLAVSPRRGRVLVAKAIVLAVVSFLTGLAGAVIAVPVGERLARDRGMYLFPVTSLAQGRVEIGTAALIAAAAVLALAVGALFRRSSGAVATVIAAIVLPYVLVATPFMPAAVAEWLTRVTPAAAFATLQTLQRYPQVDSIYTPANGYYPLAPWAGLAVLGGYALIALALAIVRLRRTDA